MPTYIITTSSYEKNGSSKSSSIIVEAVSHDLTVKPGAFSFTADQNTITIEDQITKVQFDNKETDKLTTIWPTERSSIPKTLEEKE